MDETVTDWLGRPLGIIKKEGDKSVVTDWQGKPLGSADSNGTKDFLGRPLSPKNVPGILIKKQ